MHTVKKEKKAFKIFIINKHHILYLLISIPHDHMMQNKKKKDMIDDCVQSRYKTLGSLASTTRQVLVIKVTLEVVDLSLVLSKNRLGKLLSQSCAF